MCLHNFPFKPAPLMCALCSLWPLEIRTQPQMLQQPLLRLPGAKVPLFTINVYLVTCVIIIIKRGMRQT